jgi:hypothetical protein
MSDSAFRQHARWQAGWCRALGSPFNALVCDLLAERLSPETALGRRLDGWAGNAEAEMLALRVAGGLHARVRSGKAPALAALYPPAALPDADALWAAMEPVLAAPSICRWLDVAPQTNEVARSAALMPCFLTVAQETGLPLALVELGCSGGLNLLPDHYAFRLGNVRAGNPESLLALEPDWIGPDPPDVQIRFASRIGVDLNPIDLSDPAERARMLAYVWPDQFTRLERMATAMTIVSEILPEIAAGDAADFVEARVWPQPGAVTTVFHSIAMQYFSAGSQQRISEHMNRAGSAATSDAPLAWVRMEHDLPGAGEPPTLRLTMWRGQGSEDRLLGRAHPHGSAVAWL